MHRRTAYGMLLALLIIGSFVPIFNICPVWATGTIYIRADGSIDPPDAPISTVDNVTYTLTGNVFAGGDCITIQRDNIVVDGAGYTLQGTGLGIGIDLSYRSSVVVKNATIRNSWYGIHLNRTSTATLIGNNIANGGVGINLYNSSNNCMSGNNITANHYHGFALDNSSNNNSISGNSITNNDWDGIMLTNSSNNNITENNITANQHGIDLSHGLDFSSSIHNTVSGNNITKNRWGVWAQTYCDNNIITGNNITANNGTGIHLESFSNTVSGNTIMANNGSAIDLYGSDSSTVSGNTVTANNGTGIDITMHSSNNTVAENSVVNNLRGISLTSRGDNNTIYRNNIMTNDCGIYCYAGYNNTFYHNNFMDNTRQIEGEYFMNVWDDDYSSGGNYWSDYNGTDANHDGIGDTPYIIDADNADNYPLMVQYVIPEFPSFLILPLFFIATVLAVIVYRRKTKVSGVTSDE